MSREEPGYVPPDHKDTTEFKIALAKGGSADDTVTDPAATGATPAETMTDPPGGTPSDTPGETLTDGPGATLNDAPGGLPTDDPAGTLPEGPGGTVPTPPYATGPQEPPGATAPQEPPGATAPQEPGPWTEAFGMEEQAGPQTTGEPGDMMVATEPDRPAPQAPPPGAPTPSPAPPAPAPAARAGVPMEAGPVTMAPHAPEEPGRRRPALLGAVIAAVLVLGVSAIAFAILSSQDSGGDPAAKPSARPTEPSGTSPEPGGTAPGAAPGGTADPGGNAPPAQTPGAQPGDPQAPGTQPPRATTAPVGPVQPGDGISYQLVQQDPGYFEGRMVITNDTATPMSNWTISFRLPGSTLRNVWGAEKVSTGPTIVLRALPGLPPIQPGGHREVQFGAEGSPVQPQGCLLNGEPCGF